MRRIALVLAAGLLLVLSACEDDPAVDLPDDEEAENDEATEDDDDYDVADQPDDAAAVFVTPEAGDTVPSPVSIELEAEGVELAEVGAPVVGEGHLHVLVDRGCFDDGEFAPGPSDEAEADGIYHLGDGSSEIEIDLEPGDRELCVQLGDGVHQTFGATDEIMITVE